MALADVAAVPDDGTRAPEAGLAVRTLVLTRRQRKPSDAELRRLIAEDVLPDTVWADDAIGATYLDDRLLAALPGVRGRLLRALPLLAGQTGQLALCAGHYDAVVTWGERRTVLTAALLRLRRRRPAHVAILIWPSRTRRTTRTLRRVCRHIDRLLVPSPLQRHFVEGELGVPPERIVTGRFSVDTEFWRPRSRPDAGELVCSVGQEMRDYGTLLRALGDLDLPCHIAAGTGVFDTRFLGRQWRANVGGQAIPPHVTVGRRSAAELRALYLRSRFVVIPLIPSDNDSGITAITEAFAMGKAVICTESPGQTGLLEPGVNCLRVPPYDAAALRAAMLELWSDPDRCARMGAAGRRVVEERHSLAQWRAALVRAVGDAVAASQARAGG